MNDILTLDLIIERQKYAKIYHFSYILLTLILIAIYIIFTFQYQSYYISQGKILNNELILLVNIDDLKFLTQNNIINIDNIDYQYQIISLEPELYLSDDYKTYQYLHLKVSNLSNIDNYVYKVKIKKQKQTLAKYLKDYL